MSSSKKSKDRLNALPFIQAQRVGGFATCQHDAMHLGTWRHAHKNVVVDDVVEGIRPFHLDSKAIPVIAALHVRTSHMGSSRTWSASPIVSSHTPPSPHLCDQLLRTLPLLSDLRHTL
jgi:hypothetical protein